MAARLSSRDTLLLYGVIFTCSFFFFLLGVYVGKEYFSAGEPAGSPMSSQAEPVEDVKPQLDFYNDVMTPAQAGEDAGQEPQAGDRPTPDSTGSETAARRVASQAAEPVTPSSEPSPEPTASYHTVQVGALNTADEAAQLVLRLEAKGYASAVVAPDSTNRFYRVWVGAAESRSEAQELEEQLKQDGFPTFVKKVTRTTP